MSATISSSRHATNDRTAPSGRRVVVPDRMIVRHNKGTAPIINLQPSSMPAVKIQPKKQPSSKRLPIASSKVHTIVQKEHRKQVARPTVRPAETSMTDAMNAVLERRNALPKHLARTAGRAHLLSQIVQPESQKLRWHQRLFAGLTS